MSDVERELYLGPPIAVGYPRMLEIFGRQILIASLHTYQQSGYGTDRPLRYFGESEGMVVADYQSEVIDSPDAEQPVSSSMLRLTLRPTMLVIGLEGTGADREVGTYVKLEAGSGAILSKYVNNHEVKTAPLTRALQTRFTEEVTARIESLFEIELDPYQPPTRGSLSPEE